MNKKGFIRTLESVIAIILLLTLVYMLAPEQEAIPDKPGRVDEAHRAIFDEVLVNATMRSCLVNTVSFFGALNNASGLYNGTVISDPCLLPLLEYIEKYVPTGFVFLAELCNTSVSCLDDALPVDRALYAESVWIGTSTPKIFRVYFWKK